MFTERMLKSFKADGIDIEKIRRACNNIFSCLEKEGFSIKETKLLISSMGHILNDMIKVDPLRKIEGLDYLSSSADLFSSNASSKK